MYQKKRVPIVVIKINVRRMDNMYYKAELKPCPFCGGKPYLEQSSRAFVNGEPGRVAFVRCTNCEARTGKVPLMKYGKTSNSIEANDEAVELWNRRDE